MTTTAIEYGETPAFCNDLKRLQRKFRTLEEDLRVAKRNAIELYRVRGIDNRSVVEIPGVGSKEVRFYKVRKFACRALKGRGAQSGIRIIYAFHPAVMRVCFIEMYFKADQAKEDRGRIGEYSKQAL